MAFSRYRVYPVEKKYWVQVERANRICDETYWIGLEQYDDRDKAHRAMDRLEKLDKSMNKCWR